MKRPLTANQIRLLKLALGSVDFWLPFDAPRGICKRLERRGLVRQKTHYRYSIAGVERRPNVFQLTPRGRDLARELDWPPHRRKPFKPGRHQQREAALASVRVRRPGSLSAIEARRGEVVPESRPRRALER